jgi:transketolase
LIVTCEEGFVSGGLGAAVIEEISKSDKPIPNILHIGLTTFPHAGSYKYMLSQTGLDAEHIAARIAAKLKAKK